MIRNLTLLLLLPLFFGLFANASLGQAFDEQFDTWPVDLKINGTIIAGGGLELPKAAKEYFLREANKADANPVLLQFSSAKSAELDSFSPEELAAAEKLRVVNVTFEESELDKESLLALQNSGAIWVSSNARFGKRHLTILKQVFEAAEQVIQRKGVACFNKPLSESLGRLKQDSVAELSVIAAASNLIPDAVIHTSYDDSNRKDLLSILAANPRCVGIGIEDNSAIVLRQRKIRVLGDGQSTFCLMANEHQPLRVQHVKQAATRRANPYETIIDLTAWRRDAIERTLPPFPAKKPPTPHVANGTLMIVGGGGMPKGMMEQMVELAGGEDAKMVYVPCSENDEITGPQRMVETWKKMGVASATFIHTKDRNQANTDEQFLAPLQDATGIWFGGGRQWNFSDSYYGTTAHQLMKKVLDRGGVIAGSSAGASIQARYMCRANPVANFDIMAPGYERGLGFIGGIAIDQHFSQRGRHKDMTQLVERYPQLLGIGIDEATAIIVTKSNAKIVGKGKVHFYDRTQPVITGEDDFTALADGQSFDLETREIIEPKKVDATK